MAILVFQHDPAEHAAELGRTLMQHGCKLRVLRLYAGEAVPGDLDGVDGIVSMGGPMDTDQVAQYPWMQPELDLLKAAHAAEIPIVGVCLGAQLLAVALGGEVGRMAKPEVGWGPIKQSFFGATDPLLAGIPWNSMQVHVHGCEVTKMPPGSTPAALVASAACKVQAFRTGLRSYGFQYHFELSRRDIETMADTPFVRDHTDLAQLKRDTDAHYAEYRRLGDRLAERIALCLMPLDKRHGALV